MTTILRIDNNFAFYFQQNTTNETIHADSLQLYTSSMDSAIVNDQTQFEESELRNLHLNMKNEAIDQV